MADRFIRYTQPRVAVVEGGHLVEGVLPGKGWRWAWVFVGVAFAATPLGAVRAASFVIDGDIGEARAVQVLPPRETLDLLEKLQATKAIPVYELDTMVRPKTNFLRWLDGQPEEGDDDV